MVIVTWVAVLAIVRILNMMTIIALVDVTCSDNSDSDSTEDDIVEINKQPSPISELTRLPEKISWLTFYFSRQSNQEFNEKGKADYSRIC